MRSIFNAPELERAVERLARLTPDARPRWGRMDVGQMVRHCAEALRLALGESRARSLGNAISHTVVKWLAIYVVPWPKGRLPTAPELEVVETHDLERARAELVELLRRVHGRGRAGPWGPHPLFGPMRGNDWGVLTRRHLDHHLRQFGV